MIAVSERRRIRQKGQEIMEFAGVAFLLVPMLLGGFVTGMGLIRSIVVNLAARDLANIYIHGGDFSTYNMQLLAQRLSSGLNLKIGSPFAGNNRNNTGNAGDTLVLVTQFQYVGPTTGMLCGSVDPGTCTNHDSFVYLQRVRFGNLSLLGQSPNTIGDPATTAISNTGVIDSPLTDSGARLSSAAQSAMRAAWQVSTSGRTPLTDAQVVFCVEVYSRSPQLTMGSVGGGAQYARYFF